MLDATSCNLSKSSLLPLPLFLAMASNEATGIDLPGEYPSLYHSCTYRERRSLLVS